MPGSPAKTLAYGHNGGGRDSYIAGNNGGFYPQKQTTGVHQLGKFLLTS